MKASDISVCSYEDMPRSRSILLSDPDITPFQVYYTLKSLFGPPDEGVDEIKSQWAYYLRVPGAYIEVYDWKIEVWHMGIYEDSDDAQNAKRIGNEFLELLRKNLPKSAGQLKRAMSEARDFILQNPFALYYGSAEHLLSKAEHSSPWEAPRYCLSAFFLFIASLEGLLNLLYELYLKPELRDDRIYDRLSREQIDLKVRLAPLYCSCFRTELIDHRTDAFKRFQAVVNLRNDFIHANFTQPMRRPIAIYEENIFVIEQDARDKYGFPRGIAGLQPRDLTAIKETIDEVIQLLLGAMKPRFRYEFEQVLSEEYIQLSIEEGEMIVI